MSSKRFKKLPEKTSPHHSPPNQKQPLFVFFSFAVCSVNTSGGTAISTFMNTGDVGIGNTSPTYRLDVKGDHAGDGIRLLYNNNTNPALELATYGTDGFYAFFKNNSGNVTAQIRTDGDTYFNGGNLGINNASPSHKLDVTRNGRLTGNLIVGGNITAQQFITEYQTETIIETSGSTKFGNTADDVHQFTGSLKLQGTADLGSGGELKTSKVTGASPLSISAGADAVQITGSTSGTHALEVNRGIYFNKEVSSTGHFEGRSEHLRSF